MNIGGDDRLRRTQPSKEVRKPGEDGGPKDPGVDQPKPSNPLLDRMKQIDPDQAKKYRQRSGE